MDMADALEQAQYDVDQMPGGTPELPSQGPARVALAASEDRARVCPWELSQGLLPTPATRTDLCLHAGTPRHVALLCTIPEVLRIRLRMFDAVERHIEAARLAA